MGIQMTLGFNIKVLFFLVLSLYQNSEHLKDTLITKLLGQFIELRHTQFFKRLQNLTWDLASPLKAFIWKKNVGPRNTQTFICIYIIYLYIYYIFVYIYVYTYIYIYLYIYIYMLYIKYLSIHICIYIYVCILYISIYINFVIELCIYNRNYTYTYKIELYQQGFRFLYTMKRLSVHHMHHLLKWLSCHKAILVITGREHCFQWLHMDMFINMRQCCGHWKN